MTGRLVVATHNAGKLSEIGELLRPFGVEAVGAAALGLEEADETGSTFRDNAILKARAAARASRLVALADDSGLCVEALDGAPGVCSARWAGETRDFGAAMARVESELRTQRVRAPLHRRGGRLSSASWRSLGRMARLRRSRAGWMGTSSSRRAGQPDLATIPSFARMAMTAPSAR